VIDNPFEMVVLIVALVMFAGVMRARYSHRRRGEEAADNPETLRLREEVAQLKDRLAVLERITIEKENSLEREIERLRDR
jgi:hypothetical protein